MQDDPSRQRLRLRRALASCVATVGAAVLAAAAPAAAEPPTAGGGFRDRASGARIAVLENGLTLLTLEDHATPVVSFQMWVKVGSRDETRFGGLAHLFEHMMFKGSRNIGPEEHAQLIQARGGRINAFTTRDFTVYHADVTAESLPLVIDLEAERLAHLDISETTLLSERKVVLEERRLRTDDRPSGRGREALMALAFQAHGYRRPVVGWRSDIESTTVEACREFFDTFYRPDNIVLSIAGDFDTEEVRARIRERFGAFERSSAIPRSPTREPVQAGSRRAVVYFDVSSPLFYAAWHAPPTGHADAEALDVLSVILSSGRSSRLYRSLVYEAEAAQYASGAYWELLDAGLFYASAAVRAGASVARVEALFFEQIERVRTEPVTAAELDKAKRQLEVALVGGGVTSHALASRIAGDYLAFGRIRPLEDRLAAIDAVSIEDVERVAVTWLRPDRRSVVHVVAPPESPGEGP